MTDIEKKKQLEHITINNKENYLPRLVFKAEE